MEEQIKHHTEPSVQVVDIQFRPGQKIYFFDPAGKTYKTGDHVIIDTARGPEFGTCVAGNHAVSQKDVVAPLRPVLRKANAQDEKTVEENMRTEKDAFVTCNRMIAEQGLDMQLVSAECAFDGSKILFFFTADERVDFRELVKSLASAFHTRIELRQIGVRDKARMVGGLGICGRPFCCASFLEDFQPVSIKMAKTQNLSLNPTKISGTCGRLMCCLKYEQDAYEDLIRTSPKAESFVDTPDGRGTVVELDLLRQRVKVRMENAPETIGTYANDEIAVLRNGKAKKTDPPIPADLAPISGGGKRERRLFQDEKSLSLEPIRFRYSTEEVAEAVPELPEEEPETAAEKEGKSSRRRRSRGKGQKAATQPREAGQTDAPKKEQPKKEQPKKEQPKKEAGKKEGAKNPAPKKEQPKKEAAPQDAAPAEQQEKKPGNHRRRHHHHRSKKPKAEA